MDVGRELRIIEVVPEPITAPVEEPVLEPAETREPDDR